MPSHQDPPVGDDTGAAARVTAAAESLVLLWGQAQDDVIPRIPALQVRVLSVLARQGPMDLTRLAQTMGIITPSASRLCDRLEAAGLLNRQTTPDNRREITVNISTEGRWRLCAFAHARQIDFTPVLARMSAPGRAALLKGLLEFGAAAT